MGVDAEHGRLVSSGAAHCPFCRIVAHDEPAAFVLESERVAAFVGLRQPVPGHVLIVPRRHVETLYDLDREDGAAVMAAAVTIARALRDEFAPQGLSLWQSNGLAAFQEVPHFHLHVQPRWTGDGLLRIYPDTPPEVPWQQREGLAARIRARLQRAVI